MKERKNAFRVFICHFYIFSVSFLPFFVVDVSEKMFSSLALPSSLHFLAIMRFIITICCLGCSQVCGRYVPCHSPLSRRHFTIDIVVRGMLPFGERRVRISSLSKRTVSFSLASLCHAFISTKKPSSLTQMIHQVCEYSSVNSNSAKRDGF